MLAQILRGETVLVPELDLPVASESTARIVAMVAPALSGLSTVMLIVVVPVTLFLFLLKDARWKIVLPAGIGFFLLARILPFLFAAQIAQALN